MNFHGPKPSYLYRPHPDGLQVLRNEAWRERNAWKFDYALESIAKFNERIEACDQFNRSHRRLLTELVNTAYDWLEELEEDH